MHNWVYKVNLQPEKEHSPDHSPVNEIAIQLTDQQYWLSDAVNPDTYKLLHTTLEPTGTNGIVRRFVTDLREKHDVDDVPNTACRFRMPVDMSCERYVSRR